MDILTKFGMTDCKPRGSPMEEDYLHREHMATTSGDHQTDFPFAACLGSVMYVSLTRPDIANAVSVLARNMANPTSVHAKALKHLLCYLKGTSDLELTYQRDPDCDGVNLHGYVDAAYATDPKERKSTAGWLFRTNTISGPVAWLSSRQKTVCTSSTHAEYVAAASAAAEVMYLRNILNEFGFKQTKPTLLYEDNQAVIAIASEPQYHKGTRHVEVPHHYARCLVKNKIIKFVYTDTNSQMADIMTKPLSPVKLRNLLAKLMGGSAPRA